MTPSSPARPYGLWNSPISASSIARGLRLSDVLWDSDGQTLLWLEGRSSQGVLVCASLPNDDAPRDLSTDLSVRAQVGYGGGEFVAAHGHVFFVAKSGRLYRQALQTGLPEAISPEFGQAAAPAISPDGRWLIFVHSYEQTDVLAIVDAEGKQWPQRLTEGHDFYMQPRWHPDGRRIAYIAWNHPQMPWDGTTLFLATLHESAGSSAPTLAEIQPVAGGSSTAIFQPEFSPDGRWLSYISDEEGWGSIFLYDLARQTARRLTRPEAEYGQPAWVQGMRTYGWSHKSQHLYAIRNEQGFARLDCQHIDGSPAEPVAGLESYTWLSQPALSPTADTLAVVASSDTQPARLLVCAGLQPNHTPRIRIVSRAQAEVIAPTTLSQADPVIWQTDDGSPVHGLLYLPPGCTVAQLAASDGARPPAIIKIHGGPTSQAVASFSGEVQFFTTRGYVVLMINYRGSTGYGRSYMEALRGNWGICDVQDAVGGARHLVARGIADERRLVIMGSSSGGYTVLETLCRAPGIFRAGICLYGISNLFSLAMDTHKFEARYLDSLIGTLPAASDSYRERSPIFHAELIRDPLALFQGEADKVVPRAQSDAIAAALRRRGIPHEYHVYEGEGHGWRKRETIEQFYKTVEAFLQQYVLFA